MNITLDFDINDEILERNQYETPADEDSSSRPEADPEATRLRGWPM